MASQVPGDRGRRLEHQARAQELQWKGGMIGIVKYTVFSSLAVTFAHLSWPLFRRQTLALKGFIISSAAVAGLVLEADKHLLKFEGQQRLDENKVRRQARNELAREGVIATEGEIKKWMARRERAMRDQELELDGETTSGGGVGGKG